MGAGRGEAVGFRLGAGSQHAELIAAKPVGLAASGDGCRERGAKSRQEHVAGGVAEAVVIALEAVEIEDHERERPLLRQVREHVREVLLELSPVAQSGQRVGACLDAACAQQGPVLRQGERHPDQHQSERGGSQRQANDLESERRTADQDRQCHPAEGDRHKQSAVVLFMARLGLTVEGRGQGHAGHAGEDQCIGHVAGSLARREQVAEIGGFPCHDRGSEHAEGSVNAPA